jgi:adenosylcobinamide-GDP ribazoletransferase
MKGWGLASAFRTLTCFRVPGRESESPAATLYWFVPVGIVLGLIVAGVGWLGAYLSLPYIAGVIAIALLAYITRGFHLDGLADMADGFGGGWSKERRLEIMKDSHIGAFGVIILVLVLVGKIMAAAVLVSTRNYGLLCIIPVYSRLLVVAQSVLNPYARKEGGTAGRLVTEAKGRHLMVSIGWATCVSVVIGRAHWPAMLVILAVGIFITLSVAMRARSRVGGVTGDILGATVELSEFCMGIGAVVFLALPI